MSHKTSVKTKLNNKEYLCKALDELGYKYEVAEGNVLETRGKYRNTKSKVEILIHETPNGNCNNEIGFAKKEDGTYETVGDFYFTHDINGSYEKKAEHLRNIVTTESKKLELTDMLENYQFQLDQTEENDKELELTFTCWE